MRTGPHTDTTKAVIRAKLSGRPKTAEHRAAIAASRLLGHRTAANAAEWDRLYQLKLERIVIITTALEEAGIA